MWNRTILYGIKGRMCAKKKKNKKKQLIFVHKKIIILLHLVIKFLCWFSSIGRATES